MKGNTKIKHKRSSRSDWARLDSGKKSVANNKIFAPQIQSNRNRFRIILSKLVISIALVLIASFIIYEVFLSVREQTKNFHPISSIMEMGSDIQTAFESDKGLPGALIYDTLLNHESYSAIAAGSMVGTATIKVPIRQGDTMVSLLKRYGFLQVEADAIQTAFEKFNEQQTAKISLRHGSNAEIEMSSEGIPKMVKIFSGDGPALSLNRLDSGSYNANLTTLETKTGERILFGSIETSFGAAATKSGLSYDLIDDLVDIFSDRVSFHRDFRKGDRFTIIYQEHEVIDSSKSNSGTILAAALEVNGKHFVAVRFVGSDGKTRYFNEKGEVIGDSFLRFPVKFTKISSYFTTARFHPVLKIKRPHNGVDFAAPTGTPVRTVGDGVVEFSGRKGGHGIIVEIRHSDRYVTGYSHLSSIAKGIKRGARVERGQLVGAVGMTGLATGPHLHFSLFDRGKYVDPLKTDLPRSEEIGPGKRMSDRYFKRALFTLEHYQSVASSSLESGFGQ